MAGAMPSSALLLMPVILPLLYLLYRRFGIYFPMSCVCAYGAVALTVNYDILTVGYFCFLFFALGGLVFSAQFKMYLACATVAAVTAILGAVVGVGIIRLAENKPMNDIVYDYVVAEREDPVIGFLSRNYYSSADIPDDIGKLEPSDDGYELAAAEYYAESVRDDLELYLLYYCVHYGAVFAAVGYFMSVIINRRTASCYDCDVAPEELQLSTRALGGVRVEMSPVSEMRIPRAYLWTCLLPAFVAGIVLEFVGDFSALSATVMHTFVTIPTAFCFYTLAAFFASLFKGKARVVAYAVLYLTGAAMVVFPFAVFVCSLFGVCDVILNLRFWTRFIMED